ncbi:acyl-CoA dehydrogenase family protein [Streptomyces sp. NPDC044984]|uniref:acyl-CoA dehydrogenase family protein n=1 Tax=Streptomyces sp. NPDC044984 TaxID=3154335 RepID=UPI0033D929C3
MTAPGRLGSAIPEAYGGAGQGMTDRCLFPQETSYGPASISGFGTTVVAAAACEKSGTGERKRVVLQGVADGRIEAVAMPVVR